MNNEQFSIVLQTILEKNEIKKELEEIQKIVDKHMIKITPKLETASLESDLKTISNEITQTLNAAFGKELNLNSVDVFKSLNQELQQISATTTQIAAEIKTTTEQLSKTPTRSKFSDTISKVANFPTILDNLQHSKIFDVTKKNLD